MATQKKQLITGIIILVSGPLFAKVMGNSFYLTWVMACIGIGLYAIRVIYKRGLFLQFSLLLWLLVGWWFLLIMILFGPITLIVVSLLPSKKR